MSELKSFEECKQEAIHEAMSLGIEEESQDALIILYGVLLKAHHQALLSLQKEVEELKKQLNQ